MKKTLIIFAVPLYLSIALMAPVNAWAPVSESSAQLIFEATEVEDSRVTQLAAYLESHNSPLAPYSKVFVEKADEYGLPDWKLVPAIAGVESTFGKAIPKGSYNAYGWANGKYSFESWEESIDVVSKTLKEKYIDRGADTVEKIAPIYAPPSKTWAGNVKFFMSKIESYEEPQKLSLSL